jgi:hypothetical protein
VELLAMQEANGSSAQGLGGEAEQQEGFGMFLFSYRFLVELHDYIGTTVRDDLWNLSRFVISTQLAILLTGHPPLLCAYVSTNIIPWAVQRIMRQDKLNRIL